MAYLDYLGNFNELVSPLIEDDLTAFDPPEVFPGRLPNLGYVIHSFPEQGFMGLVVSIFLMIVWKVIPWCSPGSYVPLPEIEVRSALAAAHGNRAGIFFCR
ncbi:MAG: hypothetical protein R3F38_08280 [Gammaproteobacteria bacterium]